MSAIDKLLHKLLCKSLILLKCSMENPEKFDLLSALPRDLKPLVLAFLPPETLRYFNQVSTSYHHMGMASLFQREDPTSKRLQTKVLIHNLSRGTRLLGVTHQGLTIRPPHQATLFNGTTLPVLIAGSQQKKQMRTRLLLQLIGSENWNFPAAVLGLFPDLSQTQRSKLISQLFALTIYEKSNDNVVVLNAVNCLCALASQLTSEQKTCLINILRKLYYQRDFTSPAINNRIIESIEFLLPECSSQQLPKLLRLLIAYFSEDNNSVHQRALRIAKYIIGKLTPDACFDGAKAYLALCMKHEEDVMDNVPVVLALLCQRLSKKQVNTFVCQLLHSSHGIENWKQDFHDRVEWRQRRCLKTLMLMEDTLHYLDDMSSTHLLKILTDNLVHENHNANSYFAASVFSKLYQLNRVPPHVVNDTVGHLTELSSDDAVCKNSSPSPISILATVGLYVHPDTIADTLVKRLATESALIFRSTLTALVNMLPRLSEAQRSIINAKIPDALVTQYKKSPPGTMSLLDLLTITTTIHVVNNPVFYDPTFILAIFTELLDHFLANRAVNIILRQRCLFLLPKFIQLLSDKAKHTLALRFYKVLTINDFVQQEKVLTIIALASNDFTPYAEQFITPLLATMRAGRSHQYASPEISQKHSIAIIKCLAQLFKNTLPKKLKTQTISQLLQYLEHPHQNVRYHAICCLTSIAAYLSPALKGIVASELLRATNNKDHAVSEAAIMSLYLKYHEYVPTETLQAFINRIYETTNYSPLFGVLQDCLHSEEKENIVPESPTKTTETEKEGSMKRYHSAPSTTFKKRPGSTPALDGEQELKKMKTDTQTLPRNFRS